MEQLFDDKNGFPTSHMKGMPLMQLYKNKFDQVGIFRTEITTLMSWISFTGTNLKLRCFQIDWLPNSAKIISEVSLIFKYFRLFVHLIWQNFKFFLRSRWRWQWASTQIFHTNMGSTTWKWLPKNCKGGLRNHFEKIRRMLCVIWGMMISTGLFPVP